jgi:hypothetical protein
MKTYTDISEPGAESRLRRYRAQIFNFTFIDSIAPLCKMAVHVIF